MGIGEGRRSEGTDDDWGEGEPRGVMGIGEGRRSEGTNDGWGEGEPEIMEIAGGTIALIGGGEATGDHSRLRWGRHASDAGGGGRATPRVAR